MHIYIARPAVITCKMDLCAFFSRESRESKQTLHKLENHSEICQKLEHMRNFKAEPARK